MKIDFKRVVDVRMDVKTFFMQQGYGETDIGLLDKTVLDQTQFHRQIFLYKRYISQRKIPTDRWEPFECEGENGCYCLDKHDRIIKSRLKPGENLEGDFILKFEANLCKQMHEGSI